VAIIHFWEGSTVQASTGPGSIVRCTTLSSRLSTRSRPSIDDTAHSFPSDDAERLTTPRKLPGNVAVSSSCTPKTQSGPSCPGSVQLSRPRLNLRAGFQTLAASFAFQTFTVSSIDPEISLSSCVQTTPHTLSS
jgi:hypothetical protein